MYIKKIYYPVPSGVVRDYEGKENKCTHIRCDLTYRLGGICYTTYRNKPRGYYISIQPIGYYDKGGYVCEEFTAFTGYSGVIVECSRKSKKAESEALDKFMREHKEIVKRHFAEGDIDFENPMRK
jgi:hypothetical protein